MYCCVSFIRLLFINCGIYLDAIVIFSVEEASTICPEEVADLKKPRNVLTHIRTTETVIKSCDMFFIFSVYYRYYSIEYIRLTLLITVYCAL